MKDGSAPRLDQVVRRGLSGDLEGPVVAHATETSCILVLALNLDDEILADGLVELDDVARRQGEQLGDGDLCSTEEGSKFDPGVSQVSRDSGFLGAVGTLVGVGQPTLGAEHADNRLDHIERNADTHGAGPGADLNFKTDDNHDLVGGDDLDEMWVALRAGDLEIDLDQVGPGLGQVFQGAIDPSSPSKE